MRAGRKQLPPSAAYGFYSRSDGVPDSTVPGHPGIPEPAAQSREKRVFRIYSVHGASSLSAYCYGMLWSQSIPWMVSTRSPTVTIWRIVLSGKETSDSTSGPQSNESRGPSPGQGGHFRNSLTKLTTSPTVYIFRIAFSGIFT